MNVPVGENIVFYFEYIQLNQNLVHLKKKDNTVEVFYITSEIEFRIFLGIFEHEGTGFLTVYNTFKKMAFFLFALFLYFMLKSGPFLESIGKETEK